MGADTGRHGEDDKVRVSKQKMCSIIKTPFHRGCLSKTRGLLFLKYTGALDDKCKHKLWIGALEVNMWEDFFYLRINYISWKKNTVTVAIQISIKR